MASGEDLQTNWHFAGPHHPQLTVPAMGQVDHPVVPKRSAVVDAHHDAATVVDVGDAHPRPEGQGPLSCGESALAKSLTAAVWRP